MQKAGSSLAMGVFVLALALLMLKTTGNFWGWLTLFAPGALMVGRGLYHCARE